MKIIFPNVIELVDQGPVQTLANYPLANLTKLHEREVWKADATAVNQVTINLVANGPLSAIALFGLMADGVRVEVYSEQAMVNLVEAQDYATAQVDSWGSSYLDRIWIDLVQQQAQGWIKLIINSTNHKTPTLGIVAAGVALDFPNPNYPYSEGRSNRHEGLEMADGSLFLREKAGARIPHLTLEIPRSQDADFYKLERLYHALGVNPFAACLVHGLSDSQGTTLNHQHAIWAVILDEPTFTRARYALSTVELTLRQYV